MATPEPPITPLELKKKKDKAANRQGAGLVPNYNNPTGATRPSTGVIKTSIKRRPGKKQKSETRKDK